MYSSCWLAARKVTYYYSDNKVQTTISGELSTFGRLEARSEGVTMGSIDFNERGDDLSVHDNHFLAYLL